MAFCWSSRVTAICVVFHLAIYKVDSCLYMSEGPRKCNYRGNTYKHGQKFRYNNAPCSEYECSYGKVFALKLGCEYNKVCYSVRMPLRISKNNRIICVLNEKLLEPFWRRFGHFGKCFNLISWLEINVTLPIFHQCKSHRKTF
ncbi:hypothetical protein PoB_005022400 [Plakobranchus ocellatus]|uniref:Secreted protein n=1 Tax=Plakobranchus ocellatus TaxID=259542 RepID=A0AAV4BU55_9GAST|nr:hypothetical protein PoB_005022400 [Plakobranchus ocellatus]